MKLILDYSKWRCGGDGENKLGEGRTALRNKEGFCCCLGQWSLQLGATEEEILDNGEPHEIKTLIPLFVDEEIEQDEEYDLVTDSYKIHEIGRYKSTNILASDCIKINDKIKSTPDEKIEQLKKLLNNNGIELEVINKPLLNAAHATEGITDMNNNFDPPVKQTDEETAPVTETQPEALPGDDGAIKEAPATE